jgi:hypothetical protein
VLFFFFFFFFFPCAEVLCSWASKDRFFCGSWSKEEIMHVFVLVIVVFLGLDD